MATRFPTVNWNGDWVGSGGRWHRAVGIGPLASGRWHRAVWLALCRTSNLQIRFVCFLVVPKLATIGDDQHMPNGMWRMGARGWRGGRAQGGCAPWIGTHKTGLDIHKWEKGGPRKGDGRRKIGGPICISRGWCGLPSGLPRVWRMWLHARGRLALAGSKEWAGIAPSQLWRPSSGSTALRGWHWPHNSPCLVGLG